MSNGNATTGGDFTPNASTINVTGNYLHDWSDNNDTAEAVYQGSGQCRRDQ